MALNSQDQESFKPLSLTYSAPPLIANAAKQVPEVSYNAFPELNEKALDKSLSASPQSGKFNLLSILPSMPMADTKIRVWMFKSP